MKILPDTIPELCSNIEILRTITNQWLFPKLHSLPPSRTRREVLNSLEDITGFLTGIAEVLPEIDPSVKHISPEEHLTMFLCIELGECFKVFIDRSRQRAADNTTGWKVPVIKEEWLFLKEYFLIAAAQATFLLLCENPQKEIEADELEAAQHLAAQILWTWYSIDEVLSVAAGVRRFEDEEE